MGAGWIAKGADTPAPAGATTDPWAPAGPDKIDPSAVRAHADPDKHPIENTRGLLSRTKDLLFGHEPESSDADRSSFEPGILPSIGHAVDTDAAAVKDWATKGPALSTLATAYPHLFGAQVDKLKAGYQETVGASEVQSAEQQIAAYNVLPQVAAHTVVDKNNPDGLIGTMAQDPLVQKTARKLGMDPKVFAGQWAAIQGLSPEQMADNAAGARATLDKGQASVTSGRSTRNQAWADERVWQPSDLKNGGLDPWSLKGLAFNTALAIPDLAAVTGVTVAAGAVAGPGAGVAAGAATAAALFAPAQREDAKNKIDDQVTRLMEKADALDDAAPVGGKRGLNPMTQQIRQQAADLAASSDKIANTAGLLYAVSDVAGALPVANVLTRSPAGKAILDRMVGAAAGQTVGGRIAGTMVANGAGGMLQASIQKAVDAGIIHEDTPLSQALKDIAYTGVTSAITAAPIAAAHEAVAGPGIARARRNLDSDELLNRVHAASDAMGANQPRGETYPGYQWNETNGRYEPTTPGAASGAPRLTGTQGPAPAESGTGAPRQAPPGASGGPGAGTGEEAATQAPPGAAGARAAYQSKLQALNEAASAATKRSDVTLEPEEEGWSVHVQGQPVAKFDTVEAAREAMAQARKVVGTKPASAETNPPADATEPAAAATNAPIPETARPARIPEDELERTQPAQAERRSQGELRQRVTDMTPDQMKAALLTHETTGIPNKRAYEDSVKQPSQVFADVDSLKWINDNASHDAGDQMLKAVATAMHEETGGKAYHLSGDEFAVQGASHAETEAAMARVRERLAGTELTFEHPDGRTITLRGIGVSHGTGSSLEEAERNANTAKQGREAEGLRAARGEQPPGARVAPRPAGLQAGESQTAGAPGTAQGLSGGGGAVKGRIKARTSWHGLPIGIENPVGSVRTFKHPDGSLGRRTMKAPYGEFTRTEGADGDGVDVFLGPDAKESKKAFVIDQLDPSGKKFDEHKVILGTADADAAKQLYLDHYQKGWKGFGGITELNPAQLKRWLKEGDLAKPIHPESVPASKVERGPGPDSRHDSLLEYLARHGRGLDSEEAEAQGIDKADMALSAAHVGIKRAFRKGGMSFDHAAEHLHEAGYPVADDHGHYSPNALLDKVDDELRGTKVYSHRNEARLTEREHGRDWREPLSEKELAKLDVEAIQHRLAELEAERERLEREIERAGLNEEAESPADMERIPFQRKEGASQQDLFGDKVDTQNAIKQLEAALDKKRNSGQESTETGRPDDLFSQSRRQLDLADAADEAWSPLEPIEVWQHSPAEIREYIKGALAGGHKAQAKVAQKILDDKEAQTAEERAYADKQHPVIDNHPYLRSNKPPSTKLGEETTRYEVREPVRAAGKAAGRRRSAAAVSPQLDIFANADLPRPAVQAAQLAQSVRLAHVGEFHTGVSVVRSWEDAAHILAPLRKLPQENMAALVLDAKGKPLAVIRHSIGDSSSATVEAWSLAGSIVQVPGAKSVFFAHNHPSGLTEQSPQDDRMTGILHNLLEGSGITPRGMIVVGPGSRSASYHRPSFGEGSSETSPITAAARRGTVKVQQRRFARVRQNFNAPSIRGADDGRRAILKSGERSGVLLVNQRHQALGVIPMTPEEMMKLRTGDPAHGAGRLLSAMTEANANALIAFGPLEAARNVAVFGNASGARALDAMHWDSDGDLVSASQAGEMPSEQVFLQRQFKPPEGWAEALGAGKRAGMSIAEVRSVADKFVNSFAVKPQIVVAANLAQLTKDPQIGESLRGAQDGEVIGFYHPATHKIYLVADQLHHPEDVAATMAHEFVGHFGLRAAYGDRLNWKYQAILDGMARAMPAEMRRRGEREFPGIYNPLNAHHRNVAAEETLTYYGQRYVRDQSVPAQAKRWLDKWMAMIRDWIRQVLGLPKKFDELFVKRTLADLESFLRKGSKDYSAGPREAEPAFAGKEDTFFSGLAKAVDAAKREKGTGAEWEATLRNMPGVKAEELQWTGLKDWLEGRGRVSKDEVADYVNAHRVQLGESLRGKMGESEIQAAADRLDELGYNLEWGDDNSGPYLERKDGVPLTPAEEPAEAIDILGRLEGEAPKFSQFVTPGGQNYRELLLTLTPPKDQVTAEQRLAAARAEHVRSRADYMTAVRDLFEAWGPSQLDRANMNHWLTEAADPTSELQQEAMAKLERHVVPSGAFPDGGRQLLDRALAASARTNDADRELSDASRRSFANGYRGSHWDEPNVLAHIRFDDRTGPNGERVLHLAEVQSDWHQKGHRQGYGGTPASQARAAVIKRRLVEIQEEINAAPQDGGEHHALLVERATLRDELEGGTAAKVPNAPFKTTWPELAMKRMLRYAAEHGYDKLSWDTGETNAERYNLANHVGSITATKIVGINGGPNTYKLHIRGPEGNTLHNGQFQEDALERNVGKELAEKIANQPPGEPAVKYEGLDLKVGGEGMKAFYDKMLPATVSKLVKKWGSSVQPGVVESFGGGPKYFTRPETREGFGEGFRVEDEAGNPVSGSFDSVGEAHEYAIAKAKAEGTGIPVHSVDITPKMRDSVMGGQPMFARREDELQRGILARKAAREAGEELPYADPLTQRDETVAMFLKRRQGSAGAQPAQPSKGAYALARRAIAYIPNNEFVMSLRRIADPSGVSEFAKATANVTREALGELAHESEQALQNLERYSKQFDLLSIPDRMAFIHSMETGEPQKNRELQPAADAIRKLLDDWRERIRGLGTGALDNFIENYFPHIWKDDSKAKAIFGQIFGRRPLKGPASFLKERTIPTTKEGLEKGLTPISTNPLVLAFAKLREMQRFYTGVKLMQRFKDEGLAKFLPSGKLKPDDWAEINDAVGRVRQWSEIEQGFIERGKYIMPADAARVINNHLSVSALRNFLPAQVFRAMSNAVNALQLGFSAFHLGFTTLDAIISKVAVGIERLAHGEPLKASMALLEAATGPGAAALNLYRGYKLLKAYANTGAATPQMRQIVQGLSAGGGRIKMDNYYQAAQGLSPFKGVGFSTLAHDVKAALTQPHNKVWEATKVLTSFPHQYATRLWHDLQDIWAQEGLKIFPVMSALEVAGRLVRGSTSIIMEHIVPLQKLGVFSDLAADHIRRNPLEDPVSFNLAMQKIWDSVDNRLGEMVYDNVFWNRTFKEVNHMAVRAVGWNVGTIREVGGAPVDVIKLIDYLARGAPPELPEPPLSKTSQARLDYEAQKSKFQRIAEKLGHKIPYTIGLVAVTMIVGAMFTRLFSGKNPEETKDYFFPWTGRYLKNGAKERMTLPTYMKDIVEYWEQPMQTIINKANPLFGIIHAIYANEDFFGAPVRTSDAPVFWQQMREGAEYALRQSGPFSIQGAKQYVAAGENTPAGKALAVMPFIGVGPAPGRITNPEAMDRYKLREEQKAQIRRLRQLLRAAMDKKDTDAARELKGDIDLMTADQKRADQEEIDRAREAVIKAKARGKLTEHAIRESTNKARDDAEAREKEAAAADKISSLVQGKSRGAAVAALHAAGMPAFAALWGSLPEQPRPRVAESLDAFA